MMSSSNSNGERVTTFRGLLSEIDMIQSEGSDLNRAVARGEENVSHIMEKKIERDLKETDFVEQNIVSINKEISDLEEKEKLLDNSIKSCSQSSKLLIQMETEAEARLHHEENTNSDLYHKLYFNISDYTKKVKDEESKMMKIPEYHSLITLEEQIRAKNVELSQGETKIEDLKIEINDIKDRKSLEEDSWL